MATDLEPRNTSSKPEAYLQRKFADLCARIKRIDLIAHLLLLSLAVLSYALFIGIFDWFADNSTTHAVAATRWIGFAGFLGLVGFLLVQMVRCGLRRVNPYFVAHQLEATLPDSKNSLINWLDLHDETLPSAFQKTLSARAAEQLQESDVEQTIPKRKNWILLGSLAVPILGLLVLLLLGPAAFGSSMLRAFLPFYTPTPIARTQIEVMLPAGGDAEVHPTEAITFTARIEGRVPVGNRPDAPTLSYRYHASEDYLPLLLRSAGAGTWTTLLSAAQLRNGFTYKISAGDAETREFHVRVRTRTHVKKFEITYLHRTYRKLPTGPFTFPNDKETKPIIRGPRGSEVEVVIRASRPMQKPSVEVMNGNDKKKLEIRKLADDAFSCRLTLDQSGQFRVAFSSSDGEENSDRDWYNIVVLDDDTPTVVLTNPGKDVEIPENGTLTIEGLATSDLGLKNLTLHLRDVTTSVPLAPMIYRPEMSFLLDDGTYLGEIPYLEVVDFNRLKNDKDTNIYLPARTVIEYWLEATDCSDYRKPAGNLGKSSVYKITLIPKAKDVETKRKAALDQKTNHDKKQDTDVAAQKKQGKSNQGSGGDSPNLEDQHKAAEKEKKELEQKLKDGLDKDEKDKAAGETKSGQPQNAEAKQEPQSSPDGPQPQKKDSPMMPDEAGKNKEQGDGASGEAKNDGGQEKSKDNASKGERKDGPKDTGSGAKDAEPMKDGPGGVKDADMNKPMPAEPREPAADEGAPMASAKGSKAENKDGPPPAGVKGIEKNGPDLPNKDQQADSSQPPDGQSKAGKMNEGSGDSKQGPPDEAKQPGSPRGDDSKAKANEPSWDDIAKMIEQLPKHDAAAEKNAKDLADLGKDSADSRKSEIAQQALKSNDRDPKTGKEVKTKSNPFGSSGKSSGISDDVKAAAANREFTARIGQMQLDDWKKRMTPELLRKAGLNDTDWQRYLKSMQSYDALVRQLNAKMLRDALKKELIGSANVTGSVRDVETIGTSSDPLHTRELTPPELQGPNQRFQLRKTSP